MKTVLPVVHAPTRERVLLIGVERLGEDVWARKESLEELGELVKSAGAEPAQSVTQRLERPIAATYIGKGKAEEFAHLCQQENIQSVVFDDELTPAQGRNLERIFARKVIDRTQLILDIFAQRAKTREGKLQIELAQLRYTLPRLTRMWTHLSRQSGGIGTRGPGETQLEVDRRRVLEKISRLNRELDEVRQHRTVQRQGRQRQHWPIISLVGYTNAGKSTLLNRLTAAQVYAANQLFATLDPTTRQYVLPNKQKVLLTDTVGFLKKLPHGLIESFKATLEEVSEADLLLHIVDLSHPQFEEQMIAVEEVLKELEAETKQTIIIFNKVDAVANPALVETSLLRYPGSVAISARDGRGMDTLLEEMENRVSSWRLRIQLSLPLEEQALLAELHRVGRVLDLHYTDDRILLTAHVPPMLQGRLRPYIVAVDDGVDPRDVPRGAAARTLAQAGSGGA